MPAQLEYLSAGNALVQSAELCNIGLGGAYIKLEGDTEPGSSIDLSIIDQENRFGELLGVNLSQEALNLKIYARVVRVESLNGGDPRRGVAMEFTSPVRFAPLMRKAS